MWCKAKSGAALIQGMRAQLASALAATIAFALAACDPPMPPIAPDPTTSENAIAADKPQDSTPHVVRRLVAEAQDQMAKNQQMAAELPDLRGRQRAQAEVDRVAGELSELSARIDNADSDNLDDVMRRLSALNSRIDDLHDQLRVATERTSAVASP